MSLQRVVVTYRQVSTVLNQNVLNRIGSPLEATSIRAHLDEALQELRTAERTPGVLASPEHQGAALLQSFLAKRAIEAQKLEPLPTGALEAKFDDRDWLAWAGSFFTWWKGIIPHRWLTAPAHAEVFPNTARLAMLGDWGTGMYGAPVSAKSIENDPKGYHLLMHLGDVYYSGTDDEVNERFLELWPKSAHAVSRSLNSNHEMYTGGHAYFQLTLRRFQQPASYFALQNDHWMLVGLDSAYEEHDLAHGQVEWLRNIVREAGDRKIILFSHHQPFSWFEKQGPKLTAKLNEFLTARKIFAWYWGHEHRCILYEPHPLWGFYGRCIGHGGYPYFRDDLSAASLVSGQSISTWRKLEATSTAPGGLILDGPNPYVPQHENEYGPQGYVTLEFSDAHLHEVVYLPDGTQVYARQLA